MHPPISYAFPAHNHYRPAWTLLTELPFIVGPQHYRKRGIRRTGSLWHVSPTDDYQQALATGREYAAHFVQYLLDNPFMAGANLLGRIATDMDFHDASAARGYWIGFFSYLEQLLYAQSIQRTAFVDLDRLNQRVATL